MRLTLDDWMARLYGDDPRPADGRLEGYGERVERCFELIWQLTQSLMAVRGVLPRGAGHLLKHTC